MNKRLVFPLIFALAVLAAMVAAPRPAGAQTGDDPNPHGVFDPAADFCTTCHQPHDQAATAADVCSDCHTDVAGHQKQTCARCHDPHAQTDNAALIRSDILDQTVAFAGDDFVGSPAAICVVCHDKTRFYNVAGGEPHFQGRDCTLCHPHGSGFSPDPQSCDLCHGAPPESGAHVRHGAADIGLEACSSCHIQVEHWTDPGHRNGSVDFGDGANLDNTDTCNACHGSAAGVAEAKAQWATDGPLSDCLSCHNQARPGRLEGRTAPAMDGYWSDSAHGRGSEKGRAIDCQTCHDPDAPHFGPDAGARLRREPAALCAECHSQNAGVDSRTLFDRHGYFLITQPGFFDRCDSCHARLGLTIKQEHFSREQGDCTLCHSPHGSEYPAGLRQAQPQTCGQCHRDKIDPAATFAAHAEAEDLECSVCHDPHLPQSRPAQIERDACQTCHDDLPDPDDLAHPHQPFADGRCADCHPGFHQAPDAPLPAEAQAAACNACHDDHGQTIAQPHPAGIAGQCLQCHSGHGSDQPKLLRRAEADICAACHAEKSDPDHTFAAHTATQLPACSTCHAPHEPTVAGANVAEACAACHDDLFAADVHSPVAAGECAACHREFHGQSRTKLAAVEADACSQCHELEPGRVQHPPVETGQCGVCHRPHNSTHPSLLQSAVQPLCGQCHSSQAAAFDTSAHDRLRNQCSACHQAHGGDFDALLAARTNALCDTCHANLPHGFHPVSGGGLSCTSCHLPHGSNFPADLMAAGDALCLTCHSFPK